LVEYFDIKIRNKHPNKQIHSRLQGQQKRRATKYTIVHACYTCKAKDLAFIESNSHSPSERDKLEVGCIFDDWFLYE